ncbi:putative sphingolipid transporter spinster -like protein 3 [Tanacetum coccineum]
MGNDENVSTYGFVMKRHGVWYDCCVERIAWLGIFYMCIPTGVAVGYVYGGLVRDSLGWRFAFFGEATLMLPFAILGFTVKSETKKEYMVNRFASKKGS